MIYFKKADLAETYHISVKTITNWIRQAKDGKLNLELVTEGDKAWIANTTGNITLIEHLVEERRKFRNTRSVKTISPKPEFYDLYTEDQIFDICNNIETYREIPFQYGYFDGGADYWNTYASRLAQEQKTNILTATVQLLNLNFAYIDELLRQYTHVNVIDVGVGNALPVRDLLQHLINNNKMGSYIALDISPSMLDIAQANIHQWFGDTVPFQGHAIDITRTQFSNLLLPETLGERAKQTINLVTVLGGTFANLRFPDGAFASLHSSMGRKDLLFYALKLDTESSRQYFDFSINNQVSPLDAKSKMVLDLLGLNEAYYEAEVGFDSVKRQRYIRIRLNVAVELSIDFKAGKRQIALNKNDTILLWQYWHSTAKEIAQQMDANNFDTIQSSQTEDGNYLLTISRLKRP